MENEYVANSENVGSTKWADVGQASLSNIEEHYQEVPEDIAPRQWAKATYNSKKRLKAITEYRFRVGASSQLSRLDPNRVVSKMHKKTFWRIEQKK